MSICQKGVVIFGNTKYNEINLVLPKKGGRLVEEKQYEGDYKEMYLTLFRVVTVAIRAMEEKNYGLAEQMLIEAQQKTEEIFMETEA